MKKILTFLFSPFFMGMLFIFVAVAMAMATFIENGYGTAAARSMVYNTKWFELVFLILAINMTGQIVTSKLYRKEKLPVFIFHLAFIVMITGAGITRYTGWEGTIHLREGEQTDYCLSKDKFISYSVKDANGSVVTGKQKMFLITSSSVNSFKADIKSGNKQYELVLSKIVTNAVKKINGAPGGKPAISLIISTDMTDNEIFVLLDGESGRTKGLSVGLNSVGNTDISISVDSGSFFISSKAGMQINSMENGGSYPVAPLQKVILDTKNVVIVNGVKIVPRELLLSGAMSVLSVNPEYFDTGQNAVFFTVTGDGQSEQICLWKSKEEESVSAFCKFDGKLFNVEYGPKRILFPFRIALDDFIIEHYPGSTSPSGYKSRIYLSDSITSYNKRVDVSMNNILKYNGYRFFQASYDTDEKGSILSVNHDRAGMIVTYIGYALLFISLVITLISKSSLFHKVNAGFWNSSIRKIVTVFLAMFIGSGFITLNAQNKVPDKECSEIFGKTLVLDQAGRIKPLYILSSDILRKVSRDKEFNGMTPMQVFLGIYGDFESWKGEKLIRVSNKDLQKTLGIKGNMASFTDIIGSNGNYKLSDAVDDAYSKSPAERTKTDKEVMKVDERVNIIYMIGQGQILKIFPLKDEVHSWGTLAEALSKSPGSDDSTYLIGIMAVLGKSLQTNDIAVVRQVTGSIGDYQNKFSQYKLPSKTKINAERLYSKLGLFEHLFPFYATVGLLMIISLIIMIIVGKEESTLFFRIVTWLLFTGFILHTFGIGLRWYVAGHSPLSNGYESMLFISWITLGVGLLMRRKSPFVLSSSALLAGMALMVAHLSFMDPEITNLMPVLNSFWLTLHVSVITGSYGFLGVSAITGLVIMILLASSDNSNKERISDTIDELTVINYRMLTLGLCLLTIGTFLGAIWANESWGRYWGWDPKETWSLITIIIYSLVIHSRMIPGMKDIYTFNMLSLFAFFSVLMTYFGVNYYLSGLHSYASGSAAAIPVFVYIIVFTLVAVAVAGYLKYSKWEKEKRVL